MADDEEDGALRCDGQALVDFLQELLPETLRAISAIWPKGIPGRPKSMPEILTRVFRPDEAEACKAWVERMNNMGFNIYFNPNPPRTKKGKKPNKEDIAEVRYLFVDVDPRAGESLQEERERISQRLLGSNAPKDVPKPTLVIDSGGGYWGFWKLDTPVSLPQGRPEEQDDDEDDEEESEDDDDG